MRINPPCNNKRADCHFRKKDECRLLHATYSASKKCPFFKTTAQFEAERLECPLLSVGALNKKDRFKAEEIAGASP